MKKIILAFLLFIPIFSNAQRDAFDQSIEEINKVNNILIDCMASFLEYPEIHSNTIKVYDRILTIKDLCKDQQSSKNRLSNTLLTNPKVNQYYGIINEMQIYSEVFEELLRPFMGYNSAGLTQDQMTILDPLFRKFNWDISILDINCKDTYFFEYELKGCKIMFIKNTLPPDDHINYINHNIEVDFTYNYSGTGGSYYIGGGMYRIIQFKDNQNNGYYKVVKASSQRR